MASKQEEQVAVVAFPFSAQSHLNNLLHFSLNLSNSQTLSVHYVASGPHIRQARARIHGRDATSLARIHFHELPVPHFPIPAPDPTSSTKFPLHAIPAWEAPMRCQLTITSLLQSISSTSRRLVVIYDSLMSFAARIADSFPNAECYMLRCPPSFFSLSLFFNDQDPNSVNLSEKAIRVLHKPLPDSTPPEFWEFVMRNRHEVESHAGDIFNSCRGIEGEFLEMLAGEPRLRGKKVFAVGPLCPIAVERKSEHNILDWLDRQPAASVVYVSFGSTTTFTDEQIEQLAIGLKNSGHRFIWVLRDADRGDVFAEEEKKRNLPIGYEEEVEGFGVVVRGWAPQLEILAHTAIGAFVTHCGWNSCMESLSMGVPIVGWPMHTDQPRNEIMLTEYLNVGVSVRDWAREKELVTSGMIEKAVSKVMVGEEAMDMRKRARSLSEVICAAVADGGSSRAEFDSFVTHITR